MVAATLALIAVVATADSSATVGIGHAALGVTATVVRPAEISIASTREGRTVVTIDNSTDIEVLTTSGIITQADANALVTIPTGGESVSITLIY